MNNRDKNSLMKRLQATRTITPYRLSRCTNVAPIAQSAGKSYKISYIGPVVTYD